MSHECHGLSNQHQLNCLYNRLSRIVIEKMSILRMTAPFPEESTSGFLFQGVSKAKAFSCHYVIITMLWTLEEIPVLHKEGFYLSAPSHFQKWSRIQIYFFIFSKTNSTRKNYITIAGVILNFHPANGRQRYKVRRIYKVMPPLIGWAQT